jgi:hypothetical protein
MWLWGWDLHRMGFRRRSEHYRQCERRYGLPAHAYLSIFVHTCESDPAGGRERVEISAFHVTFRLGIDRIHFYYHEADEQVWEPGGHTSSPEIRHHGVDPAALRQLADEIAGRFLKEPDCRLLPRPEE